MPAVRRFPFLAAGLLAAALLACDEGNGPRGAHAPAAAAVFLDGVDMRDQLILPAGGTVRLEIGFFDEQGEPIGGIEEDHFASLGFLPGTLASVTGVTGENFRKDVTGGAELGTGTYRIGYGHDEAASDLSFGPFGVTVVATGAGRR